MFPGRAEVMAGSVRGSTLLVRADVAEAQLAADAAELREREAAQSGEGGSSVIGPTEHPDDRGEAGETTSPRRFGLGMWPTTDPAVFIDDRSP